MVALPEAGSGGAPDVDPSGVSRRRFIGYLIAAPTLVVAVDRVLESPAAAEVPTVQPVDNFDLTDLLTLAAQPGTHLITVTVNSDGTVSFALPRAEVGQGITTAIAMTIADELDMPIDRVKVTLADADPKFSYCQFTGGSNTMHALFEPVRTAAAIAKGRLLDVAAGELGLDASELKVSGGVIFAPDGRSVGFDSLAERAAVDTTRAARPRLKPASDFRLIGSEQRRIDAYEIVTGRKRFAMDLEVPKALPTMVCRPPNINGTAVAVANRAQVLRLPGVTDVAIIPHSSRVPGGVAVRARTFGQCIDAVRALRVKWGPGTADGKSADGVLAELRAAEQPMTPAPPGNVVEREFIFNFRPGDPLEPNCAVADVRSDRAEIWSSLKSPIWAQEQIATDLGLPLDKVTVHVTEGGGSFGRHLFGDAAFEAAAISRKIGKPVKLMWHRTDSFRQGRAHAMAISRVRVVHSAGNVLSLDQRHTGIATDQTSGFGEITSNYGGTLPEGNYFYNGFGVFPLTAKVVYDFGGVSQTLNEIDQYDTFNTSDVRNIYSPDVCTSIEVMVDLVAQAIGNDPYQFRREYLRDDRLKTVLDKAAHVGRWGRSMPRHTAQGIAVWKEYKGAAACLVEIDCRPPTVKRHVPHGYAGPRVTKAVYVVDVGLPINTLGLKAQMMGGIMDGIAQALTYSLHLRDGYFLEGSWDHAHYTRQWNTPLEVEIVVMPPTTGEPGGAGEFGVAASMAATACAYGRAVGTMPTEFPINHHVPLSFKPLPTVPPIPQSPTDGLKHSGPTLPGV